MKISLVWRWKVCDKKIIKAQSEGGEAKEKKFLAAFSLRPVRPKETKRSSASGRRREFIILRKRVVGVIKAENGKALSLYSDFNL